MGLFDDFASRTPPMNIQAEMALLGALLMNNKVIDQCDDLAPEHFAGENLGALFAAIREGIAAGHVVDAISLDARFDRKLLLDCVGSTIGFTGVAEYAGVIQQDYLLRELIEIGRIMSERAFNASSSPGDVAAMTQQQIDGLMTGRSTSSFSRLDTAMDEAIASAERVQKGEKLGISTGFTNIDRRLGGLEPKLVYLIGARPSMGKSALELQIAINVARQGYPVLLHSLEMSAVQMGRRALSSISGVPIIAMKTGQYSSEDALRIVLARQELNDLPLVIDDSAGQTPTQISMKSRADQRKRGTRLILIDHLNLMRPEDADVRHGATWATERASGAMLLMAKDLDVPVVLLSQLNRGLEGREDKRPGLPDLRQSGALEQDAYAVGFIYREEYYAREPQSQDGELSDPFTAKLHKWHTHMEQIRGKAELIWAKVRDGETGTDLLSFHGPTTTFGEWRP